VDFNYHLLFPTFFFSIKSVFSSYFRSCVYDCAVFFGQFSLYLILLFLSLTFGVLFLFLFLFFTDPLASKILAMWRTCDVFSLHNRRQTCRSIQGVYFGRFDFYDGFFGSCRGFFTLAHILELSDCSLSIDRFNSSQDDPKFSRKNWMRADSEKLPYVLFAFTFLSLSL